MSKVMRRVPRQTLAPNERICTRIARIVSALMATDVGDCLNSSEVDGVNGVNYDF